MSTLECSVHQGVIMSTLEGGDTKMHVGDIGTNEKRPLTNFQEFCSHTFCDYAVVYAGLWNIRQLLRFLYQVTRAQTLTHFLFHL